MSDLTESHIAMARMIDALFCSELKTGSMPTKQQLAAAIRHSVKTHRNWNGCTRAVAAAFSATPQVAIEREQWCHQLAEKALQAGDIHLDNGWQD